MHESYRLEMILFGDQLTRRLISPTINSSDTSVANVRLS